MSELLKAHTNALFTADCMTYHRFIELAPIFKEGLEKATLNRFWRVQLGYIPTDTRDARMCLDDNLSDQEWLDAFQRHVLPVIVTNGLPKL